MNTVLKPLAKSQIPQLSACLERDFPPEELLPLGDLSRLYANRFYQFWLLSTPENPFAAYAICAARPNQGWVLLVYLAVDPALRDQGLGGRMMEELRRVYKDCAGLVIEAERPDAAENEEEKTLRNRRFAFYFRHGAHVLLDQGYILFGVDFSVLTIPIQPHREELSLGEMMRSWYRVILPPQEMQFVQFSQQADALAAQ